MEFTDAKIGMKIRNMHSDMGIGEITAIGRDSLLAVFPSRFVDGGVEIKIDPTLYEQYTNEKLHTYTVTLNCKDNQSINGVFMKDGIVIGTDSIKAVDKQDFDLKDGLSICLENLLDIIEI